MSEEATPQVDPKYKQPASGAVPDLAPTARGAFRALLWVGLVLAAVGVIVGIIGATMSDYETEAKLAAYSFSGSTVLYAVILLAASGVVAGLGKREASDPA